MKKIISLITIVMILSSFALVASATDIAFTLKATSDYEGAFESYEYNAGDIFYVFIDAGSAGKGKISALFSLEDTVFSIAQYEGADDVSLGKHTGTFVMNPFAFGSETVKLEDAMTLTAVNGDARPPKFSGYVGLQIADDAVSGEYEIAITGAYNTETVMAPGDNCSSNTIKIKVNGTDPVPAGPNWNKIDVEVAEFESDADVEAGYAYGVNYTCAGAAAMIFAAGAEDARLYSNEITVEGTEGAVNVGFVSADALENVGVLFRDADKANIWYSLDVDKH